MNLKNLNVQDMNSLEMVEVEGGLMQENGGWAWLAGQIIDNWDHIKAGAVDGWNGTYNPR